MIVTASQGPAPVETEIDRAAGFRCPACGLETPTSRNTADGAEVACPRCEARLKLRREMEGFRADETGPPQFAGPAMGERGTPGSPGDGEAILEAGESEAAGRQARVAFILYEFGPWQVLPMRTNPGSDTILYVARGQGIMLMDDEERSVDAETAVYAPAGATYGLIAGDNAMTVAAVQCPLPVETRAFEDLGYSCPACGLGTPVTTSTFSGCVTVCPRCNVKLKLRKTDGGFEAEETSEPAPASAETI